MSKKNISVLMLLIVSIFVLWIFSPSKVLKEPEDGLLSSQTPSSSGTPLPEVSETVVPQEPLYDYQTLEYETPDGPLVVHLLSVDLKNPRVAVKPVLSHRTLFGYEYLSVMAEKYQAIAAVNGGFSYSNGLPGGMIYSNKELKTPASGNFPILFITEDKASITDARPDIWLTSEGKKLVRANFNKYSEWGGIFVFSPVYGSSDRMDKPHFSVKVSNGIVTEMGLVDTGQKIPPDGFLVSAVGSDVEKRLKELIHVGMELDIHTGLDFSREPVEDYLSAYECGSWLVRDGVNVCPETDAWAGNLTGRAPRTAVGIKDESTLVFAVVDGRQKDVSVGMGGPELAGLLIKLGVKQAALLDGGASSEMIIEGKIVNSPSAGRERMLFSCFILLGT